MAKEITCAMDLFPSMPVDNILDQRILHTLAVKGCLIAFREHMERMRNRGQEICADTLESMIRCFIQSKHFDEVNEIFNNNVAKGIVPTQETLYMVLITKIRLNELGNALEFFEETYSAAAEYTPRLKDYEAIIYAASELNKPIPVYKLYKRMKKEDIRPSLLIYKEFVVPCLGRHQQIKKMENVMKDMVAHGFRVFDPVFWTRVLKSYDSSTNPKHLKDAIRIWLALRKDGKVRPTVGIFVVALRLCIKHGGLGEECEWIRAEGVRRGYDFAKVYEKLEESDDKRGFNEELLICARMERPEKIPDRAIIETNTEHFSVWRCLLKGRDSCDV